jgi:Zn-finger nucleic acid-binding protein
MPELKCPRDGAPLTLGKEQNIEVDRCPTCSGAWYDDAELAELEASVTRDDDHLAGTVEYAKRTSEIDCPACGTRMRAFNYRAYNLELDACEDGHGFWLDAGEAARVREVMKERVSGMRRHASAQRAWNKAKGRGDGGVLDNLFGKFRRR